MLTEEQKNAVEESQGYFLSAGAGSGKTHTIIEKILFDLEREIEKQSIEYSTKNRDSLKKATLCLVHFFRSRVLITFTVNAAEEMRFRLARRLKQRSLENSVLELAGSLLGEFYIGTIHGLCRRILIDLNILDSEKCSIVRGDEQEKQFRKLFLKFIEGQNLLKEDISLDGLINQIFLIYTDPAKRFRFSFHSQELNLEEIKANQSDDQSSGFDFIQFDFKQMDGIRYWKRFKSILPNAIEEVSNAKNVEYLDRLISLLHSLNSFEELQELVLLIENKPRFSFKKDSDRTLVSEFKSLHSKVKKLIEKFQKSCLSFDATKYRVSREAARLALNYFEIFDNYCLRIQKLDFSQLEYFCFSALRDHHLAHKKTNSNPWRSLRRIMVDEYQDTSLIQNRIFEFLSDGDRNKLLFIGDLNQSIYGFRGAQLDIIKEQVSGIPLGLKLSRNFRSNSKIVEFNNKLFNKLLPDYIPQESQQANQENSPPGEIPKINFYQLETETNEKIVTQDASLIENQVLVDWIKTCFSEYHCNRNSDGLSDQEKKTPSVGLLFRHLSKVPTLLSFLRRSGISYTAKLKLDNTEKLIFVVFYYFLRGMESFLKTKDVDANSDFRTSLFHIEEALKSHQFYIDRDNIEQTLKNSISQSEIFPLNIIWAKFVSGLGLYFSDYEDDFLLIDEILSQISIDLEKLIEKLDTLLKGRSEIVLTYLASSPIMTEEANEDVTETSVDIKVDIMSVHSSKGLEFDFVWLYGVSYNGNIRNQVSEISPFSAQIQNLNFSEELTVSPQCVVEQEYQKELEISEGVRLFYVATTRAAEKLGALLVPATILIRRGDCWANHLEEMISDTHVGVKSVVFSKEEVFELKRISRGLGGGSNMVYAQTPSHLRVVPELSVTALASLSICPKKFYYESVISTVFDSAITENKDDQNILSKKFPTNPMQTSFEFLGSENLSSKKRGTQIHNQIEKNLKECSSLSESEFEKQLQSEFQFDRSIVDFFIEVRRQIISGDFDVYIEEPLRISIYHWMIRGVPDLLVFNKVDNRLEIVDFKTGQVDSVNKIVYFNQILAYAYGFIIQHQQIENIELAILWTDSNRLEKKSYSPDQIKQQFVDFFGTIENLHIENWAHCSQCQYVSICRPAFKNTE